jgi:hypothetical protein
MRSVEPIDPLADQTDSARETRADDETFLRAGNPFPLGTPAHQAYRGFLLRVSQAPEYRALVLQLMLEDRAHAEAPDFTQQLIAELVDSGIKRLNDADLKRYHEGTFSLLLSADDKACGQIARAGVANPMQAYAALATLPRHLLDEWFAVRYRAVLASLRGEHPASLDPDHQALAMHAAFLQLQGNLRSADYVRVVAVLSDQDSASDTEVCSAVRHFYSAVTALPADLRTWAYRTLVPE